MAEVFKGRIAMFEHQDEALLNQGAPVQNTWYTLLAATAFIRVYGVGVGIEDTDETLEVRITRDTIVPHSQATPISHSGAYYAYFRYDAINQRVSVRITATDHETSQAAFLCEGHNITIEVRKTTAAGVGNLVGVADYGVLVDVP